MALFLERYVINPPRIAVEAEGRTVEGVSCMVQNGQPYTFFSRRPVDAGGGRAARLRRSRRARCSSARTRIDVPTVAVAGAVQARADRPATGASTAFTGVDELRVRSTDERPVPLQVDGDYIGEETEAVFGLTPGGLRVVA